MRAGRPAGRADGADVGALLDTLTLRDIDMAQVRIHRRAVVAVADLDDVAVTVLPAGEFDDAVADRAHRGAAGGAVVDTFVLLPGVDDRVHAHREAGGHARELHRAREELAALALAVETVVGALAVRVLEPDRGVALAVVDELGGEDAAD